MQGRLDAQGEGCGGMGNDVGSRMKEAVNVLVMGEWLPIDPYSAHSVVNALET